MIMHSCVFAYWGWYWREVYHEIPLILAQVFFLYVLDMLVCWSRRDKWILGFGPIPIIFSMNLFLWFRDDWFYLQFVMVAIIVFGKEFLRWKRDGHLTHIFNPSAFALFLTSVVLLATHTTPITWGAEISSTFNLPPNIYIEIFLLGLDRAGPVLGDSGHLVRGGHAFCAQRRLHRFHRHVPFHRLQHPSGRFPGAASSRDRSGHVSPQKFRKGDLRRGIRRRRIRFVWMAGQPWNADVLRQAAMRTGAQFDGTGSGPRQHRSQRLVSPAEVGYRRETPAVAGAFGLDSATGEFWIHGDLGGFFWIHDRHGLSRRKTSGQRPRLLGKEPATRGARKPAMSWPRTLDVQCQHNSARGCFNLGMLLSDGKGLPRDPIGASRSFKHACDIGLESACGSLVNMVKTDGDGVLLQPCSRGDGESCFMLGSLYYGGQGVSRNLEYSAALFQQSCTAGFTRGCGQLGESYLFGEGVPKDIVKASRLFEGLPRDPISAARGFARLWSWHRERLQQCCESGENRRRRCIAATL